ncbi:MAG: ribose-phosphate diphosphokinase [Holosporales bacterium]|nr:ribose-phosphate diphosphokinase [Holosporales bacterium]
MSTTVVIHESTNTSLAKRIAKNLGVESIEVKPTVFPNGEVKIHGNHIEVKQAIVIFPKIHDINRQLIEFMLMCGLCKGCTTIDAVIPYIPHARQNDTVAHAMILKIFGVCRLRLVVTVDIHNPRILDSYNIINILPHEIFANVIEKQPNLLVVAPDRGAIHRAQKFADAIGADVVFINKNSESISNANAVAGMECIIIDDIIDSGRTISLATNLLRSNGCASVSACISHGFFATGTWHQPSLDDLYISESFDLHKQVTFKNLRITKLDNLISAALSDRPTHTERN